MRTVGVDVGGTGVRAAIVDHTGRVGAVTRRALPDRSVESVCYAIRSAVRDAGAGHVDRVGVGIPGFVRDQKVVLSPNFPQWRDVALASKLGEHLRVPVFVENDANVAALGVWRSRGMKEDVVLITLGTGVGGGIVSGGRLITGATGVAGEVGHIYVGGSDRCNCGGVGCLEAWSSTTGMLRRARAAGFELENGEQLFARAREGDAMARNIIDDAAAALGRALVTLTNLFNPDVVVITGGLSNSRDELAPLAERWLQSYAIPPALERVEVVWDPRADQYAILGAGTMAAMEQL